MHSDEPDVDWYIPAVQLVQLLALAAEYVPEAHGAQLAVLTPVAAEYSPAVQIEQLVDPVLT